MAGGISAAPPRQPALLVRARTPPPEARQRLGGQLDTWKNLRLYYRPLLSAHNARRPRSEPINSSLEECMHWNTDGHRLVLRFANSYMVDDGLSAQTFSDMTSNTHAKG